MRWKIASTLRAFANWVEPQDFTAQGRRGDRVWTAPCDVNVVNLSSSKVDVSHQDGAIMVVVHPRFESRVVTFPDRSVGLEYGPETGAGLERAVEWPRGGASRLGQASEEDWSACDAARWVSEDRSGWTHVDEVELDVADAGLRRRASGGGGEPHAVTMNEGAEVGVSGVVPHE